MAMWDGDFSDAARRQGGLGVGNYQQYTTPTGWQVYVAKQAAALALSEQQTAKQEDPLRERTQEEIIAQCEARMAQLEREAEQVRERERLAAEAAKAACSKCRWAAPYSHVCSNPLVKGFDQSEPGNVDWLSRYGRPSFSSYPNVALCGREKALWEPKLRWWERLIGWVEEKCN